MEKTGEEPEEAGIEEFNHPRFFVDERLTEYMKEPKNQLREYHGAARVVVCQDPLLGGIGEALKSERLAEIVERCDVMMDIFILCVDRDGEMHRRRRLDQIEAELGKGRAFLAENAWEELEAWVLGVGPKQQPVCKETAPRCLECRPLASTSLTTTPMPSRSACFE